MKLRIAQALRPQGVKQAFEENYDLVFIEYHSVSVSEDITGNTEKNSSIFCHLYVKYGTDTQKLAEKLCWEVVTKKVEQIDGAVCYKGNRSCDETIHLLKWLYRWHEILRAKEKSKNKPSGQDTSN